ncbi:MAG: hypothetical protein L6R39_004384 [Caloplaca ligustica]|nr:MAG: hypothetical protein L6R39_004384 [Caloplaca ligustica]
MTFRQRLNGFLYLLTAFSNITTTLGLLALVTSFVSSGPLIAYTSRAELHTLLRFICAIVISTWLGDIIASRTIGYAVAVREGAGMLWIAPYIAVGLIRAIFLPTWLGGSSVGFTSSGSLSDDIKERDPTHRAPFWPKRARHFFLECHIWIHLTFFLFMLFGVGRRLWTTLHFLAQDSDFSPSLILMSPDFVESMIVNVSWPPILAYGATMSALVPVLYACWPPSVPEYGKLLQRNEARQASYPTKCAKKNIDEDRDQESRFPYSELKHTASMLYVTWLMAWTMM